MNLIIDFILFKLYVRNVIVNDLENWSYKIGRTIFLPIKYDVPKGVNRVYFYGASSEDEIMTNTQRTPKGLAEQYIVRLDSKNIYSFTGRISEKSSISYISVVGDTPVRSRLHELGLIHGSNRQKKVLFWKLLDRIQLDSKKSVLGVQWCSLLYLISRELLSEVIEKIRFKMADKTLITKRVMCTGKKRLSSLPSSQRVLITGWYGTETVGDKAILMEIVNQFKSWNNNVSITITSIIPSLSLLTNQELNLNCDIIPLNKVYRKKLAQFDCVVFGGGPIMDSTQLRFISRIFCNAKRIGIHTLIFGCGVGPLKSKRGAFHAKKILSSASGGFFRDEESAMFAMDLGWRHRPHIGCDPALNYVRSFKDVTSSKESNNVVCLFREQTVEYSVASTQFKNHLKQTLGRFTGSLKCTDNLVKLLAMHSFWYGKDDRLFNEEIKRINEDASFDERPCLLDDIISECSTSGLNVVTRFHGHIFSVALGIPFISLDYTGTNGKIESFLRRYDLQEISIDLSKVDFPLLEDMSRYIRNNRKKILQKIEIGVERDLDNLSRCYKMLSEL